MTRRRNRPVYAATLYHDSPTDAAVDWKDIGYFPSLQGAVDVINAGIDDHWQTGGIQYGFLWETVPGKWSEHFELDERERGWFVGTDGKADR